MNSTQRIIVLAAFGLAVTLHGQSSNGNGQGSSGAGPSPGAAGATSGSPSANSSRAGTKFELPRLKANGRPAGNPVARGRATVHELREDERGKGRHRSERNIEYVALDANTSWSETVRGGAKDITFVSFFVYASPGTTLKIGAATLLVRPGAPANTVQMQIGRPGPRGMQWQNFGGPVRLESYEGAALAALPVLTVRLDGAAGIWDLYVGGRLGAVDIPMPALPAGATKRFTVHAGSGGARICGLISSDDNPLYEDENRNGIDDAFELQQNGGASIAGRKVGTSRSQLAKAWQEDQQARQAQLPVWTVQRPLPDRAPGRGR